MSMTADTIEIRRLAPGNIADAALFRDIRLEALRTNPEAFGSSFDVENAQPASWFSDRLGSSVILGAFRDTELVGIAGFAVQQGRKSAHKGLLKNLKQLPTSTVSLIILRRATS